MNFLTRPELDQATLNIAADLVKTRKLGRGTQTDLIAVGLSVTDFTGHSFGTGGPEMCAQMLALDAALGRFFDRLDAAHIRYAVMLTADHGGHDLPERNRDRALGDDQRIIPSLTVAALNAATGHGDRPVWTGSIAEGDLRLATDVAPAVRGAIIASAKTWLAEQPQVAAAFSAAELGATPLPSRPPETWTLAERAAASFDPERSGDLTVLLKPRVVSIGDPTRGYVATHGSPWDYDRRVPILFWWNGMRGFEQPNSIQTVDIMPTLAGLIGLPLGSAKIDGQCRDLDPGPQSTCPAAP